MEYDNTNTGVLFKHESDNERAPAYKGKLNVGGTDYQLSAWIHTGKDGRKFMSLKVELPRPKAEPKRQESLEDDIPF